MTRVGGEDETQTMRKSAGREVHTWPDGHKHHAHDPGAAAWEPGLDSDGVKLGATICVGQFQFARVDISLDYQIRDPSMRGEAWEAAVALVRELLEREKASVHDGSRPEVALPEIPWIGAFRASVSYGETIPVGRMESKRVDAEVSRVFDTGSSIADAFDSVSAECLSRLESLK